jgi:hypothetical protein
MDEGNVALLLREKPHSLQETLAQISKQVRQNVAPID